MALARSASLLLTLLLSLAAAWPILAEDTVIRAPTGWQLVTPVGHRLGMTQDAVAAALTREGAAGSRIMQLSGFAGDDPHVAVTDVPGHVSRLEYGGGGSRLLVSECDWGRQCRLNLLDAAGRVLWRREDNRFFGFSTTGEAIVALSRGDSDDGLGFEPEIEIFDLAGQSRGRLRLDRSVFPGGSDDSGWRRLRDFVLIGTGERAIVSSERLTVCLGLTDPPVVVWSVAHDGPLSQLRFVSLHALDAEHVVLTAAGGCWEIVRIADGRVVYVHDPATLAAGAKFSRDDLVFWANLNPSAGRDPGTVLLFNRGDPQSFTLDLATGALTPGTIDVARPPGFEPFFSLIHQRFVSYSKTELRIRPVQ